MQTNIDITKAFLDMPDGVLSIHQLSQKLKLPYGTTYNRVHSLHQSGVLQILPQGKAKLLALNPDNLMTANLLALGSSQRTEEFSQKLEDHGKLLKKIIKAIKTTSKGKISSAILLSPATIESLSASNLNQAVPNPFETESHNNQQITTMLPTELLSEEELASLTAGLVDFAPTLDFFYVKSDENFDESIIENEIKAIIPDPQSMAITNTVVDRQTILSMFTDNENDAGLSAYNMLHDGIVLVGYESFYEIVLEAFAKKLTSSN